MNEQITFRADAKKITDAIPWADSPGIAARALTEFAITAIDQELAPLHYKFAESELLMLAEVVRDEPHDMANRFFGWHSRLAADIDLANVEYLYGVSPERALEVIEAINELTPAQAAALSIAFHRYWAMPEPRSFRVAGVSPEIKSVRPSKSSLKKSGLLMSYDSQGGTVIAVERDLETLLESTRRWLEDHPDVRKDFPLPDKPVGDLTLGELRDAFIHDEAVDLVDGKPVARYRVSYVVENRVRDEAGERILRSEPRFLPEGAVPPLANLDVIDMELSFIFEQVFDEAGMSDIAEAANYVVYEMGDHPVTDQALRGIREHLGPNGFAMVAPVGDTLGFAIFHPVYLEDERLPSGTPEILRLTS